MERTHKFLGLLAGTALIATTATTATAQLEVNGDFEAGDTSGWQYFPTGNSTFTVTGDAASGAFAGELVNLASGSAAVIKQANLGIGSVNPGDPITISFDAKGTFANGGVSFAEFFTELDGGGTSSSQILTGAPLALTEQYQNFTFNVFAGPITSGGITLQLTATTGANIGSTAQLFIDNVTVTPEPATAAMLGLGCLAMLRRRTA